MVQKVLSRATCRSGKSRQFVRRRASVEAVQGGLPTEKVQARRLTICAARESTSSPLRESSVRVTLGLTDGIVSESHWRVFYEP